ncbi:MAG: hypothetical protein JJT96_05755 [Opitutales bacterium]|nr:hypothetical protein [Opitutales bacterium]
MTNKSLKFLFALPLVALPASMMAQPVYTDPVGAVSVQASGLSALHFPLQKAKIYQGTVSSVGGATVGLASVPPLSGALYLQVLSGSAVGTVSSVVASDGSSVTTESAISGLAVGDSVAVREHTSLGDLSASIEGGAPDSATITLYNLDGTISNFEAFGGEWFDGDFTPSDDVIVAPGEGFVLALPSDITITFVGSVSVDPVLVPLSTSLGFVGNLNPVPSLANPSSVGQLFGNLADSSTITIYMGDGSFEVSNFLEAFGGEWFDPDFTPSDDLSISAPAAVAVFSAEPGVAVIPPAFVAP